MSDSFIRLIVFLSVLILMMILETILPKKKRLLPRRWRWPANLSLGVINVFLLKLLGPVTAIIAADYALDNGWGLLAKFPLPLYVDIFLGFVLLDLAIYIQHVASHRFPILWRFHRVHHVDRDIDVTTALRFHPVEALLSMLYKCVVILLLGPVTLAVLLFEIILNALAMFNHANMALPAKLDKVMRLLIVTPDMHRVHHSVLQHETDSNYGFCLSIWDKCFSSYTAQPKQGHEQMQIGLIEEQNNLPASLFWSLLYPFKSMRQDDV